MAYTLRFQSNAFRADTAIGKLVKALNFFKKTAKAVVGIKNEDFEGNRLETLEGINQRTFQRAMDWADVNFDQQIASAQWDWKGPNGKTRRKNGTVVAEPRDIVDMGTLLQSKQRNDVNSSVTEFEWTARHAEAVHDGAQLKNGGENPARPWTQKTTEEIDEVIQDLLRNGGR